MKGFEFKNVLLVDLHDRRLVSAAIPREEHWRVAFQVYVAMTRAQEALWMFSVGAPSQLLRPLEGHVDRMTAEQLLGSPSAESARPAGDADSGESPQDDPEWSSDADIHDEADEKLVPDGIEATTESNAATGEAPATNEPADASDDDVDAEQIELPFEPAITSTADALRYAEQYRDDPDVFERIMLELNERDCSRYVTQISALRSHWLMLVRRDGHQKLLASGAPDWPRQAATSRRDALSGKVFPYEQGMLSFMGYRVGAGSSLATMERRKILTYVYLGDLPTVIDEGSPGSRKRLMKLKNTLMSFVRNAQRREGNMRIAIDEWQDDLRFIHEAFG
jgi:hypothetical protein